MKVNNALSNKYNLRIMTCSWQIFRKSWAFQDKSSRYLLIKLKTSFQDLSKNLLNNLVFDRFWLWDLFQKWSDFLIFTSVKYFDYECSVNLLLTASWLYLHFNSKSSPCLAVCYEMVFTLSSFLLLHIVHHQFPKGLPDHKNILAFL